MLVAAILSLIKSLLWKVEDGRFAMNLRRFFVVRARRRLLVSKIADHHVRPVELDSRLPPSVALTHATVGRCTHRTRRREAAMH